LGTVLRSTVVRAPIDRRAYRPVRRRRVPRWLWAALAVLPLIALALFALHRVDGPGSLATAALAGPRAVRGPVCVEEAVDVSSSMNNYRAEREAAEAQLFDFARRELAPGDLFSSAFFAGQSALALPPTPMSALTTPPAVPSGLGSGTLLTPAVQLLTAARGAGDGCAARGLVIITDGGLADDSASVDRALSDGGYTRVFAVIPGGAWWHPDALPSSVTVYHFHDGGAWGRDTAFITGAKPLDVVFGDILGSLTGQTLVRSTS
jgi:hypothetical protein